MATPITWQNVNAPSQSDALRGMALAQQGITGGFDKLGEALKSYETGQQATWKKQDDAATQDVLGRIYSAQDLGAFNALSQSGALDQATAANGARIDRAAVNALRDGRTATLQQRGTADMAYNDAMTNATQAPIVREIQALMIKDPKAAQARLDANPDLLKVFELAQGIDRQSNELTVRKRADAEETRRVTEEAQRALLRPIEVDSKKLGLVATQAQINASNATVAAAADARALTKKQLAAAEKSAQAAANTQFLKESGNIYSDGILTPDSSEELSALMIKNGIGGTGSDAPLKRQKIIDRLRTLPGVEVEYINENNKLDKKTIPMPMGLVKQAILGASDKFFSWNEGYADTVEDSLKASMKNLVPIKTPTGGSYAQNKAVFDFDAYMKTRIKAAENPVVPGGKKR